MGSFIFVARSLAAATMLRTALAVLLTALAVSACDSSVPGPPATEPPAAVPPATPLRGFDLTGLPAATEIELTDADTLALPGLLGANRPAGLTLRVTGTAAAVADALVIRAEALGNATVALSVSAPGYRDTTATVAVRVVPGVCPPEAPAQARDYFPVTEGAVTSYDLKTFQYSTLQSTETLTATLQNVRCRRSVRSGEVRYKVPSRPAETQPFTENASNEVAFRTPALGYSSQSARFARYAASQPDTISVSIGLCSPATMLFAAGVGFIREGATCGSLGGFSGRSIGRQ